MSIIENPGLIYDPKDHSFYDLKDGQLLANKMTTEQEQPKNIFKELFKVDLEASSLSIKEISKKMTWYCLIIWNKIKTVLKRA